MALVVSATNTELPPPLNSVFNQTLLRNAQKRAPYFAGTAAGELTKSRGSNVCAWRRIENLTGHSASNDLTLSELQGNAAYMQGRDAAALSVSAVTATMTKYGNYVILNEEVDLYNFPGQFDKIMEVIAINAGESLNVLQRDIAEDNLTDIYVAGATNDATTISPITAAAIKNAIVTLDKNSAQTFTPMTTGSENIGTSPILPAFWGLCHPDVAVDIAGLTGFVSVEQYAGQISTVMGEFGTLSVAGKAVRFISSEGAGVDTGDGNSGGVTADVYNTAGDADLYRTCIYGQDCLGSVGLGERHTDGVYRAGDDLNAVDVIVKGPSGTGTSDPYNEISTVAWKSFHTGSVLNANWGRVITSAATDITN